MKIDDKIINMVYFYHKDLFEMIQKKSLNLKINVTPELSKKLQVEIINLTTNKKKITYGQPIGILNKNKWTWLENSSLIKNFLNKSNRYPNEVKKIINDTFDKKDIMFNEKNKDFFPLYISDNLNSKFNIIRFIQSKDKYIYFIIEYKIIDKEKINKLIS